MDDDAPSEPDSEEASPLDESDKDEEEDSSLLLQELDDDPPSQAHSHVSDHQCHTHEPFGHDELEELQSDDELSEELEDSDDHDDSLLQELEDDDIGSQDHSHVSVHHCHTQPALGHEEELELHSDDELSEELQELDDEELPSSHSHVIVHQCHAQVPEQTDELLEEELHSEEDSDDEESEEEESKLEASEELDSDEEDDESEESALEEVLAGLQTQRISLISTPPMTLTCFSSVHFSPAPHASRPRHLAHICFAEPPLRVNVYSV